MKKISSAAINALKEALTNIYWYKDELKSFLYNSISDKYIISNINFDQYKRHIVSDIINYMVRSEDKCQTDLINLITEVIQMNDFSHLERLEDGKQKAKAARDSVNALRKHTEGYMELIHEKEEIKKRKEENKKKILETSSFNFKLESLKDSFFELLNSSNPQQKGFDLEKFMKGLFELFDLDPKASFRIQGEQLDGAFTFDSTDYLFEAKWEKNPISGETIDGFSAKVSRKLDNTLGLFLSISNFSEEALKVRSSSRSLIILMDGFDLMAVLEGRIDLQVLLKRKRRHAAQTGNIFISVREFL